MLVRSQIKIVKSITQKYQMMDLAVQPNTSMQLMHQMNER